MSPVIIMFCHFSNNCNTFCSDHKHLEVARTRRVSQREGKELAGTYMELTCCSVALGVRTVEGTAEKLFTLGYRSLEMFRTMALLIHS